MIGWLFILCFFSLLVYSAWVTGGAFPTSAQKASADHNIQFPTESRLFLLTGAPNCHCGMTETGLAKWTAFIHEDSTAFGNLQDSNEKRGEKKGKRSYNKNHDDTVFVWMYISANNTQHSL